MPNIRTTSPVTGLKRISRDPDEALDVRKRLARRLQAQLEERDQDDTSPLKLDPDTPRASPTSPIITLEQMETFARELIRKGIIKEAARVEGGCLFLYPAKQGLPLIRMGSRKLTEPLRAVFTNEVQSRQKPRSSKKFKIQVTAPTVTVVRNERDLPTQTESQARSKGKSPDPSRLLKKIRGIEAAKLIGIWENARRILSDRSKSHQHRHAEYAIQRIEAEWARRNASGNPAEYFDWPTTTANRGRNSFLIKETGREGILSRMSYHVGKSQGQPEGTRRAILSKAFSAPLPTDLTLEEEKEWGPAESATRLRKIAYSIASFTRNAKRRDAEALDVAIRQWETDLKFLYDQFYVGRFHFAWPITSAE